MFLFVRLLVAQTETERDRNNMRNAFLKVFPTKCKESVGMGMGMGRGTGMVRVLVAGLTFNFDVRQIDSSLWLYAVWGLACFADINAITSRRSDTHAHTHMYLSDTHPHVSSASYTCCSVPSLSISLSVSLM